MKLLLLFICVEISLSGAVLSGSPDPKTCNKGRCGNPCAAKGLACCFCDDTCDKALNIQACFCCPKNQTCCPMPTWAGNRAHCCPVGYTCSKDYKCTKQVELKPQPADGVCGFNCREDTKLHVKVDNSFTMFIDGVQVTDLPNFYNLRKADEVDLNGDAKVITICGKNDLYKAGILLSSEEPSVIKNAVWKCYASTKTCSYDWTKPDFNDDTWGVAFDDEKNDGQGSRKYTVDGIPGDTYYKWCNNPNSLLTSDWAVYCTCRIKP